MSRKQETAQNLQTKAQLLYAEYYAFLDMFLGSRNVLPSGLGNALDSGLLEHPSPHEISPSFHVNENLHLHLPCSLLI